MKLPKNKSMNKHVVKLIEGKQPLYSLIYSLCLVELETLKTYIETHLKICDLMRFCYSISHDL